MQRLSAVVILMATLAGCSTYQGSRTVAKVGGYTLLAGVASGAGAVLAASHNSTGDGSAALGLFFVGVGLVEIGAIVGGTGLLGMLIHDKPTPEPPPGPEPTPDPSVATRARAKDLTNQATAASYAGDCATVRTRDAEVRELDPEFHATVFVRIVVIKRCLEAVDATDTQPVPSKVEAEPSPVVTPSPSP